VKSLVCYICHAPVRSSSVMCFAGELMHRKCFTCVTCGKGIKVSNGQVKAILGQDEDLHCWDCLRKAVGCLGINTVGHARQKSMSSEENGTVSKGLKKLKSLISASLESKDDDEDDIEKDAHRSIRPEPEIFDVTLINSLSDEKRDFREEMKGDDLEQFFHKHEIAMSYDKGEKIGEGSFGKVFVCRRRPDNMLMAMKQIELSDEEFCLDPKRNPKLKELLKEAQILGKLKHSNVVKFLGTQIDRNKKTLNIFMEYIPGRSMFGHLYEFGAYSEQAMKKPVYQLLQGLKYLHSQGVIHRDLKSKNILISNRGVPKLADFGSAKMIEPSGSQAQINSGLEASAQICTPLYFPPELILHNLYNEKSDIWSFGCVMIEMISAKLPWAERKFDNEWAAARYIAQDGAVPQLNAEASDLCRDFIMSCLNRDPKQRPSAEQLLAHPFLKDVNL
jgi:predicted Ser/Thr protein kinase